MMSYSYIVFGFATVNMASLAFEKIFQSVGRMKVTMVALIVGCVGNIILDPLLIFGIGPFPAMGIAGAALATGIGQALSTGIYLVVYEAAHQILADLFPNDYGKAVKCRGHIAYRERNGKPSWEEWQADTLAAELLMPTFLINAEIERVALTLPNGILYKSVSDPNYEKILEMARRIGVSWSAIRIRLQQMQVIKGKPIHCHPLDIMRFGE